MTPTPAAEEEEQLVSSDEDAPVQRAGDEEDYDLLTYGEVAARLSELLAEEREDLQTLRSATPPDAAAIAARERRIDELVAGRDRYRKQKQTSEVFLRKFGLTPRGDG